MTNKVIKRGGVIWLRWNSLSKDQNRKFADISWCQPETLGFNLSLINQFLLVISFTIVGKLKKKIKKLSKSKICNCCNCSDYKKGQKTKFLPCHLPLKSIVGLKRYFSREGMYWQGLSPEFNPQNPLGERRDWIPQVALQLTHTHTHKHTLGK